MSSFVLTEESFRELRDIIREAFGIFYDDGKQYLLQSRLQTRLAKRGFASFEDYARFLKYGEGRAEEFHELASTLTNNETYFFREPAQLKSLVSAMFPPTGAMLPSLRVWSAACSTGEEPYSLAMTLLETGRIMESAISILASDISPRVLEICDKGYYRALSFRATQPDMIQKYFSPAGDGFLISDRVKRLVKFFRLNLMDEGAIAGVGKMDAIFCRNVLIYYDKPTQKRVVEAFFHALRPGGYLFLGHAESLFHLTDLYEPIVQPDTIVYRAKTDVTAAVGGR